MGRLCNGSNFNHLLLSGGCLFDLHYCKRAIAKLCRGFCIVPYALLFLGIVLFVAGIRGTNGTLWTLVKSDFTGSNNFLLWIAAIAIVGGAGYIKPLKPLSIAFMTLLLVVLVLSNKGVFAQLEAFLKNPTVTPANVGSGDTTADASPLPPLKPLAPLAPIDPNANASPIP